MTLTPNDPVLLTPGPLTTSHETKLSMMHDWGSRDATFIETNQRVRDCILTIANASSTHVCIPIQGSGTFAVEATIGTLLPRNGKALVLINGAYGDRMAKIISYMGRAYTSLKTPEDIAPTPKDVDLALTQDSTITHVLVVHCETTSGILNPIEEISDVVSRHNRRLIIDAMSSFGGIPIDANSTVFDALMASSNKCLEGLPGLGFAVIKKSAIEIAKGNAHSLSLDLYDQWQNMEISKQWRFTPPTHIVVALDTAIQQFEAEGGAVGRNVRYSNNANTLIDGMRELGFEPLLSNHLQAPIIVTFKIPGDPLFNFETFYNNLKDKGFIIYPGKLTVAPSFRMGCIGHLNTSEMRAAVSSVRDVMAEMGISTGAP